MSILTSQRLNSLYERFKEMEVTFSHGTIQATGLVAKQIYLKCMGDFWPCVLYSSSFGTAKIVANVNTGLIEKLQSAKNTASIRFCFKQNEKAPSLIFFVNVRSAGYAPYVGSKQVAEFSCQNTQRPPDDLIEILGRFLEASETSMKRRSERIPLNSDVIRKLNLSSQETVISIEGVSRNCILRDISFFGTKLIVMGLSNFLEAQNVVLRIDFNDPHDSFLLKGYFVRSEMVEGRKDLLSLGMAFNEEDIPMGYTMRINDYFSQMRQDRTTNLEV
jgi:hypothetical protein